MKGPIVVDTRWLAEHGNDADVRIVDVRPPPFYAQGHLPGAVNLPMFLLANPAAGAPDVELVSSRLGNAGISRDTHVVAYDDGIGPTAAQLFWVLAYLCHPRASVLDGGITRWAHEGRGWEYTHNRVTPATYAAEGPDLHVLATLEDVRAAIDSDDAVILDVRTPSEYLGLRRTAGRNGHVPGAVNIDWQDNLSAGNDDIPRLLDDRELHLMYESAGVTPDKLVLVHCQTGVRSSETFMVLKELGYPRVANYVAGWQEWGNRTDTPVESA